MAESEVRKFGKDQLKSIVERIEHLAEEKKAISDDIKQVYAEAKANGFDVVAIRRVVKNRRVEPNERAEQNSIFDIYWGALGHDVEEPAYAEVAAAVADDLGRDRVLEAFQKLVPLGADIVVNFGKGDRVLIRRLDDGTGVIEPAPLEEKPPAEARPGSTVKKPATVLKMHKGGKDDPVKSAADRAEEAAAAKRAATSPADSSASDVLGPVLSEEQREYDEKLYAEAVAIVKKEQKASASYVQRILQVGYNRACQLIERMEEEKIISKPDQTGKREVLAPDDARAET